MNEEQIENAVTGSEAAVQKMLLYYVTALKDKGVEDVKQYIATKISRMIDLSEDQYNFVVENLNHGSKLKENLDDSIKLLKNIEKTKKLDLESITIVRKILELIMKEYYDIY